MSDKEFLQWIFQRMCMIHGENVNYDYMHKFKEIIDNQDGRHIPEGYKLVSSEGLKNYIKMYIDDIGRAESTPENIERHLLMIEDNDFDD